MGFVKLSDSEAKNQKISLDNVFIAEYLPSAPENFVKIYLMGLSLALSDPQNSIETIAMRLFCDTKAVTDAFNYWSEQGLVHITATTPPAIEYLPIISRSRQIRKFSKEKYRTFNDQLHCLFPNRNILPNEYNEYYNTIETYNIEVEAMLTIVGYAKRLKGEDITYPYIIAVARNLAAEGCTTYKRVNEKLEELDLYSTELKAVLKALGAKKTADHDDRRMFDKWIKALGFKLETIIQVAKNVKKGGTARLDSLLTKYYENHLMSIEEIRDYEAHRDELYTLCREINKIIGVYYEQLDFIIETYINNWLSMGFSNHALTTIADYCFRKGIRTLEGMNDTLAKFYKLGNVSLENISSFISDAVKGDEDIKKILSAASVTRAVTTRDRDYYRTWTFSWKMPNELIEYGATQSANASNPISYLNSILASWHANNITTLDAAQKMALPQATATAPNQNIITSNFSADELNAIFDKLNEDLT